MTAKGHKGTFGGDGNVPYLDCGSSYIYMYICQNSLNCTFKVSAFYITYTANILLKN